MEIRSPMNSFMALAKSLPTMTPRPRTAAARSEAQDLPAQVMVETAHDADDDDEDGHAEGDADDRDQGDDRNESPFGAQITQRQQQLKRQFRHDRRLETPLSRVNWRAKRGGGRR